MSRWRNQLSQTDCIEGLATLPAGAVDLVFADPPFNIGYSYDVYRDDREAKDYLAWSRKWIRGACRVLKPGGALWIAIGDEFVAELKIAAEKSGLHLRNWVIWYYTFGVHCKQKFTRSHTHLLYFVRDPKRFTFNDKEIRVPSARQLVYKDARAEKSGRVPDNTWILRPQDAAADGGFQSAHDTWYYARVAGTFKERAGFHGCQMPEQLLGRIIRCCSNPGEVVLDPFAGSSSTLTVAKKLGREWVGFELSPEYVRHGRARLADVCPGDPLDGPENPLASSPATPRRRLSPREQLDERAIVEAFLSAADGYSVDHLLADPAQAAAFIDACSIKGLPGRPRDWNLALLAARKSGNLGQPATRATSVSWREMDPYLHAAEIALRRMLDIGYGSLDDVLADPLAAARFDHCARTVAPGYRSFDYRWAALRLRKSAKDWRDWSVTLRQPLEKPLAEVPLDEGNMARLPEASAVYVLGTGDEHALPAYIGGTANMRARGLSTLHTIAALDAMLVHKGEWRLAFCDFPSGEERPLRALQTYLVADRRPRMNCLNLLDASA